MEKLTASQIETKLEGLEGWEFNENGIENEWNYAFLKMKLDKRKYKSGTVKIYIWNKGNGKVYIDDITFSGYH